MKVFRSQLPLKNPIYSETPPDETGSPLVIENLIKIKEFYFN